MVFTTPEYALFLLACVGFYSLLPHRWQNRFLLVASYVFYARWDYRFLTLIIISTAVDFFVGQLIAGARQSSNLRRMRWGLAGSLVCNLGLLGTFKYFDFFVSSTASFLEALGFSVSLPVLELVLPVGISFYTFQTLSYTIDIYRGRIQPTHDWVDFALFVAFFPQLVAGPIERARRLLPQIEKPRQVTAADWREGLWLILLGLVRKIVIADTAALWVDRFFATPEKCTSMVLATGLFLYGLQVYGDFSGYSNIARGSARLMGFNLMRNFEHPFFAASLADFWRRWHISLSSWLRDYVYFPLGGSRSGRLRTSWNLFVTMVLAGLWHGASLHVVAWGVAHGLYLAGERLLHGIGEPVLAAIPRPVRLVLGWLLTSAFVTLGWVLFRSTGLDNAVAYFVGLLELTLSWWDVLIPLTVLTSLTLLIDLPQALTRDELIVARLPIAAQTAIAGCLITLLAVGGAIGKPFIYFQF